MNPERWSQIEALFLQAIAVPSDDREKFLEEACNDDGSLRKEVNSLLACDDPKPLLPESPFTSVTLLGGPLPETENDAAGRRIGPYRLVRLLGRGGMGAVYLAGRDDDQFQKDVAIKLLKRGMDTDSMLIRGRSGRSSPTWSIRSSLDCWTVEPQTTDVPTSSWSTSMACRSPSNLTVRP